MHAGMGARLTMLSLGRDLGPVTTDAIRRARKGEWASGAGA